MLLTLLRYVHDFVEIYNFEWVKSWHAIKVQKLALRINTLNHLMLDLKLCNEKKKIQNIQTVQKCHMAKTQNSSQKIKMTQMKYAKQAKWGKLMNKP